MNEKKTQVLVVDDDEAVRRSIRRVLDRGGFEVEVVASAAEGLKLVRAGRKFHAILTDLMMPGIDGIEFLRLVRQIDLDVPVIVLTGNASLTTAIATVEYGGFRYLEKPFDIDHLTKTIHEAAAMHRLALLKRRALELCEGEGWLIGDQAGLDARFERALDHLWIAYQPIIKWPDQEVYGHEALVRSNEPTLASPALLFDAAERLGRVHELGRKIRRAVADSMPAAPQNSSVFVNLHAIDLCDEDLHRASAALSGHADRVVLEITERASLHRIQDVRGQVGDLRRLGYRIAIDDLGAGYAGLSSFSQLEPEIAKLDMSLIRGIDTSARKASIVRSMIAVCTEDLQTSVVCEGVETEAERDTLERLGAELLQGYLFARPAPQFRSMSIFAPPPLVAAV